MLRRTSRIWALRVSRTSARAPRAASLSFSQSRSTRSSFRAMKARLWARPSWISRAMRVRSSLMASSSAFR